jgi:hypothetical protein
MLCDILEKALAALDAGNTQPAAELVMRLVASISVGCKNALPGDPQLELILRIKSEEFVARIINVHHVHTLWWHLDALKLYRHKGTLVAIVVSSDDPLDQIVALTAFAKEGGLVVEVARPSEHWRNKATTM